MKQWRRPSQCDSGSTECVEVMKDDDIVYVRNSTMPAQFVSFTPEEMDAFLSAVLRGEYEDYLL